MAFWLLLLFAAIPIVEIVLFIQVGGAIGILPTIALVVLSAVAGIAVVRRQGLQTLERLRQSMEAGGDPSGPLAHGALIAIGGMLLFIPGFFTDAIGLLLLLPPVRAALIRRGAARTTVHVSGFARRGRQPQPQPDTIEADYEVVDDGPQRHGNSGWTRPQS